MTLPLPVTIDQIPDPHTGGMQCSAWPGLDQRRAGYGCDGMEWDGILRKGKRRHLLPVGMANPRAAQRKSRWGRALGARSGLCIERGRVASWGEAEVAPLVRCWWVVIGPD